MSGCFTDRLYGEQALMRSTYLLVLAVLLVTAMFSCRRPGLDASPELTVAAAADLERVFREIAGSFESETGAHVVLSFAASGNLKQQIENGAPFDVFASANVAYVDDLARRNLIFPDTSKVYAQGQIALWQRKDSSVQVASMSDLIRPEVKHVAIANPEHAPYGLAAVQAMESSGVYSQVAPKLVRGENIVEALQFVETGNAEAGIVALSISDRPDGRWSVIDPSLHKPIDQAIGVVASTHRQALARRFVDFLATPGAVAALKRYGFTIPASQG